MTSAKPIVLLEEIERVLGLMTEHGWRGAVFGAVSADGHKMTVVRGDCRGISTTLREALAENGKEQRELTSDDAWEKHHAIDGKLTTCTPKSLK